MVKVYVLTIDEIRKILVASEYNDEFFKIHFPKRFERSKKFHFENDTLRCLGVGILLYKILGIDESVITISDHGKPECNEIDEKFSISHSGDYIVLAVSNNIVGCDIEKIDSKHLSLSKRVLQEDEIIWFEEEEKKFFILWTLKESIMKALGKGLSLDPKSFSALNLAIRKNQNLFNKTFSSSSIVYFDSNILSVVEESEVCEIKVFNFYDMNFS